MQNRRLFLRSFLFGVPFLVFAETWLFPRKAWSANAIFVPGDFDKVIQQLYPSRQIIESKAVEIKIPTIAENGAVVPVTVSSTLPNVIAISLFVTRNPIPLAARFELSLETQASVSARLKIAETCDVVAIVETPDGLFSVKQMVKVTIGGCGG